MRLLRTATILFGALLMGTLLLPALAGPTGPHGGQVQVVDGHPIELVVSQSAMTFFLNDHDGTPMASDDATAKAFVSVEGRTQTLVLAPAAPNKLVGALPVPLAAGAKVLLSMQGHGHRIQARFAP